MHPTLGEMDISLSFQNDGKVFIQLSGLVQALEGHASGQGTVSDNRHTTRDGTFNSSSPTLMPSPG